MQTLLISLATFVIGLCLGIFIKDRAFDSQDWTILKWNNNCLGYRAVSLGSKLNRGDKIIMALCVKTDAFPEKGVLYDVD
jgi:hypothetical protein